VIGQDPFRVERIWQDVFALTYTSVRGIPTVGSDRRPLVTAMSAVDIALWDLQGKATRLPVHALLGGALRPRVSAYVTGFYYRDGETPDDLRREAALYMEQGYRTVKVKVGGLSAEADAERVKLIRRAVGPGVALMLDANQGWDLPTAVRAARLCAEHDIFWLEDRCPGTTSATASAGSRTRWPRRSPPARPSSPRSGCARWSPRGWWTT